MDTIRENILRMHEVTVATKEYDKMRRSTVQFCDYLNISHLWYYRITKSGQHCFTSTNNTWSEYSHHHYLPTDFPCVQLSAEQSTGIFFMRISSDTKYREILNTAWNKFGINLALNIQKRTPEGIEAFGIGTKHNHDRTEEFLLQELPLINHFIDYYRKENQNFLKILYENQTDIDSLFTPKKLEPQEIWHDQKKRGLLIKSCGWGPIEPLTSENSIY